jgi:hypothetical protein
MAKGSKEKYTNKQKRQARHIELGYERDGIGEREAMSRAWATVNKTDGGGNKPGGSGYGKKPRGSGKNHAGRKTRKAAVTSGLARRATSTHAAAPMSLKKRSLRTPKKWQPKGVR